MEEEIKQPVEEASEEAKPAEPASEEKAVEGESTQPAKVKKERFRVPKIFKNKIFVFSAITILAALSGFLLLLLDDDNAIRNAMGITPESVAWLRHIFNLDVTIVTWMIFAIITGITFYVCFVYLFRKDIKNAIEAKVIKRTGAGFTKKQNLIFELVYWFLLAAVVGATVVAIIFLFAAVNGGAAIAEQIGELGDPAKLAVAVGKFFASIGILLVTTLVVPVIVAAFILIYQLIVLMFGGVAGGIAKNVMASSNFQETYAAAQAATSKINEMANQLPKTISVVSTGSSYVQAPVGGFAGGAGQFGQANNQDTELFPALMAIDAKYHKEETGEEQKAEENENKENTNKRDLSKVIDTFQSFLAKQEKLYFSKTVLRTFVAGLSASRLILLEGLSGTGKSSLPRKFQQFIGGKSTFLQVQATWRDRSDIIGYYSDLTGYYKETELLKSIYESTYTPNQINLIVLDEMNISRAEYYFADFLSIYEYPSDAWKIQLMQINKDAKLPVNIPEASLTIPTNIWFVGTINVDDSTFTVTDKVYDRAIVINFDTINEPFEAEYNEEFAPVSYEELTSFFAECQSNEKYCLNKEEITKVTDLIKFLAETFEIKVGNRILNQIELFVPSFVGLGGTKLEAIDMMVCGKIFRKLDYIFVMNMGDLLIKLQRYLASSFKKGSMPLCEAKINSLLKKYQ